ncbi:NACHT domain-containing protein [Nostoc sp. UIC 10630]|uniref:NACHT domain-containing protein n=1 Tax=Nostoc sp. UIC 10630 TaxID=2100146 RepID=UPI0013D7EB6C|nr:NACHT domain-containing protein [Nostoc sp. UIC 10630]NEU83361.1 NACHT domain-containing protein [Nostoc sp. UIC 10630]
MRLIQYIKKLKSAKNSLKQQRLYVLVFTLTLWFVLSTSAIPSYSQSPTPTPRPVIEQKVRELAKSDVENDIPRRNDYAVKRFGKKSPNLKDDEILEIYDSEYTKQSEAKKNNLWEQLKPETGWSVAIVLFFILIFKDTLTTWVSQSFEFIGNQLYSKLSGSSWLRGTALKRYRKEIQEKYEKLKISFRPNRPLKLKDIYVPLKVTGTNDTDLIDAFQAVAKYSRLMVKGSPGSGKTILLKYIAFCYAEGRWADLFNKFQCVPVLVELHRFSNKELIVEQQLVEAFARDGFPNAQSFVSQSLDKNKLLLLLDGFDEVSSNERQRVVELINDFLDTHQDCPVIITCRTAVYRGEFNDFIKQTLEIVEFNDQQIRDFLVPWKSDMPPDKSVEQLMQTLHSRPRIISLARNPLMLTIIAYLYADTPVELPRSRAEFYRKAIDILLEQWHQERNQFQARDKKLILQHLALFFQDNANEQREDRRSLDWRTVEDEITSILPNFNLQPDCTRPILSEIVERNGLLLKIDGGERYQFAHLTLQEFFAASQLREKEGDLISRFKADPDAWRETLKLWCGIAGDSTNLIREVRTVDPVVAFECLADVQKIDSTLADKIINSFKSQLGANNSEDIVNHAFASVAADDRRRTDVFTFLKETLENTSETDARCKAAANVLSLTNLPPAATLLTKQYINLDNIEFRQILDQSLIRMGDIAVPEIEKAVTSNSVNQVMDVLVGIATPSALQALVNFLWSEDENRALRAALLLASLIQEEKHKDLLNACKLHERYSRQDSFDWIVKPYRAEHNLHIILQQIVFCISKKLKDPVEVIDQLYLRDLDQKLIIPICFIQALEKTEFQDSLKKLELNDFIKDYENYIQNLSGRVEESIFEYLISNLVPTYLINLVIYFQLKQLEYGTSKTVLSKQFKSDWQTLSLYVTPSTNFQSAENYFNYFSLFTRKIFSYFNNKNSYMKLRLNWNKLMDKTIYDQMQVYNNKHKKKFIISYENKPEYWNIGFDFYQKKWKGKVIINKKLARPH